jgi:hypothetical protein
MKNAMVVLAAGAEIPVRLPSDMMAWLDAKSAVNEWSFNTAIIVPLRDAMERDPLKIVIYAIAAPYMPNYAVTVGDGGKCIFRGNDLRDAEAAALAKVKELGMANSAIVRKIL